MSTKFNQLTFIKFVKNHLIGSYDMAQTKYFYGNFTSVQPVNLKIESRSPDSPDTTMHFG